MGIAPTATGAAERLRAAQAEWGDLAACVPSPADLEVRFQHACTAVHAEIADREIATRLREDHQNYLRFITKVIRKGVRQGSVRKDLDVDMLGFLFDGGGILMNMMKLLSFERKFNEKTVLRLMDHLVDSIKA